MILGGVEVKKSYSGVPILQCKKYRGSDRPKLSKTPRFSTKSV